MPKPSRHARQLKFLALLQEREGSTVTVQDICDATGWKPSGAPKTYLSKRVLDSLLTRQPDGSFAVRGAVNLTAAQFLRLLSQSKARQQFGHSFSPLVRQLLERSRTNVGLAIETFNRASLDNRLDAFVLLFIAGWEQLLKAELEHDEPGSIFTGAKTQAGRDITISFQQCLDRLLKPKDVVRKNLEVIRSLRDDAAHLLVWEVQPAATLYFQAGVTNYAGRFFEFTDENPLPVVGGGLLTLAMPYERPDPVALRKKYGEGTAAEVAALIDTLEQDAENTADPRFAIEVKYRLVLSKDTGKSTIHLSRGAPGKTDGLIIEKAVDAERRYPYFQTELVTELTKRTDRTWNRFDVRAAIFVEKAKNSDNEPPPPLPQDKPARLLRGFREANRLQARRGRDLRRAGTGVLLRAPQETKARQARLTPPSCPKR